MDASDELIRAVFARLRATAAVTALVDHFYDKAPADTERRPGVKYPYVTNGPTVAVPDDVDCIYGEEVTIQLDIWSSGPDSAFSTSECRKICNAIKRALHDVDDLVLNVNALVTLQWELTRILPDPNPAIKHGVVQFTATIETP